jgi:hypothetical protein
MIANCHGKSRRFMPERSGGRLRIFTENYFTRAIGLTAKIDVISIAA